MWAFHVLFTISHPLQSGPRNESFLLFFQIPCLCNTHIQHSRKSTPPAFVARTDQLRDALWIHTHLHTRLIFHTMHCRQGCEKRNPDLIGVPSAEINALH